MPFGFTNKKSTFFLAKTLKLSDGRKIIFCGWVSGGGGCGQKVLFFCVQIVVWCMFFYAPSDLSAEIFFVRRRIRKKATTTSTLAWSSPRYNTCSSRAHTPLPCETHERTDRWLSETSRRDQQQFVRWTWVNVVAVFDMSPASPCEKGGGS